MSYTYKNMVDVIPLAMVDDLLAVSTCGMDSIDMNVTINSIIELKNLRCHTPDENKKTECHIMHIGSNGKYCHGMKVHGLTVDSVSQAVYLGDNPGWVQYWSH